ncbi:DoxX family protein [Candidatus Woesearchaeota archaeon]|nr:DoxX family protein [Candidatus Woesearchaeota archaeon]
MECLRKYIDGMLGNVLYMLFRFLIGAMFFMHGAQKLFGWFGAKQAMGFVGLMGFVGTVEFLVGLAVIFGFLTRLAAFGGIVIMASAFIKVHLGINPLATGGELAVMYLAAFLVLTAFGARKWSLDHLLFKKEVF